MRMFHSPEEKENEKLCLEIENEINRLDYNGSYLTKYSNTVRSLVRGIVRIIDSYNWVDDEILNCHDNQNEYDKLLLYRNRLFISFCFDFIRLLIKYDDYICDIDFAAFNIELDLLGYSADKIKYLELLRRELTDRRLAIEDICKPVSEDNCLINHFILQ